MNSASSTKKKTLSGRYPTARTAAYVSTETRRALPRTKNVTLGTALVADPYEQGKLRESTVNRRVDVLEKERSSGYISEAAYHVGRQLQASYEISERIASSSNWNDGGRTDAASRHEEMIARLILEKAPGVVALHRRVSVAIGIRPAAFVRAILSGTTFTDYTKERRAKFAPGVPAPESLPGATDREVGKVAAHWRMLMEHLVDEFSATGPDRSRIRSHRG